MAIYADKKDGKLTGRFKVEVQLGGRRLRGRFGTIEDARKADKEWKVRLAKGDTAGATERVDTRSGPQTLAQLLERAAPLLWNGSTHGTYATAQVTQIDGWLGSPKLKDIDTTSADTVVLKLRALGRSPATINRYLSAFNAVLRWGHKPGRGYVATLPEITWQDEDEGRIRTLSVQEETKGVLWLRARGQEEIADYILAAIDTGCRRGELHPAQRGQLDGAWLRLWGDQTKSGYSRSVPLTGRARGILEARLPWKFSKAQLRYWWDQMQVALGLEADEDFVLHACRHTCATRLVERGVNLRVIQTWLGHRTINTTLRYTHVSDDLLAEAAVALARPDANLARKVVGVEQEGYTPHLTVLRPAVGQG